MPWYSKRRREITGARKAVMDYAARPGLGTYAIRNLVKKRVTENSVDTFAVSGPAAYLKGTWHAAPLYRLSRSLAA